jgi:hypothetical protein
MQLIKEIDSQGVFYFDEEEMYGQMIVKENELIEVHFYLDYIIGKYEEDPVRIAIVNGILSYNDEKVCLINPIMHSAKWCSIGVKEYILKTNLMIEGLHLSNLEELEIDNYSIISDDFNKYIGNSLLKAKQTIPTSTWSIEVITKKSVILLEDKDLTISIEAFYNFEKYSLATKFTVEQINPIKFKINKNISIYEIISRIKIIENFLSFIFQKRAFIKEAVFYRDEIVNNKSISKYHHIYFVDNDLSINVSNKEECLIARSDYLNLGKYIYKYYLLSDSVEYLNYYIRHYYSTKYVDQQILAQINLIEAFHRYIFGNKKDDSEIEESVQRICCQLQSEDDRLLVANLLRTKNGYGLKRKVADLAKHARTVEICKTDIEKINKIRSSLAHGSLSSDVSLSEFNSINKSLINLINETILNELKKE